MHVAREKAGRTLRSAMHKVVLNPCHRRADEDRKITAKRIPRDADAPSPFASRRSIDYINETTSAREPDASLQSYLQDASL